MNIKEVKNLPADGAAQSYGEVRVSADPSIPHKFRQALKPSYHYELTK